MVQKLSSLTMVTTKFSSPGLEPKGSEFMGLCLWILFLPEETSVDDDVSGIWITLAEGVAVNR